MSLQIMQREYIIRKTCVKQIEHNPVDQY